MRTAAALWSVLLAATAALANAGNPFSSNVIALTPKNWRQEVEGLRLLPASYPGVGEAGWCRERLESSHNGSQQFLGNGCFRFSPLLSHGYFGYHQGR
ncbi:expressed unknown protein [Seminavis robusta]|uniref:Uncharacterized protein n=1 Tax=Seminavis robusta TaxID=568900 RepID=A0A9N8EW96_9STRA|nr:expressed unknown protein [Seminavis robusta]|eukprot:Sro2218_g319570.1 n/a (98) ;mRNA; f:16212-16749